MPTTNEQIFLATPISYGGERVIASPFQFLFTGEDRVRFHVVSSVVANVLIGMRFLNAAGDIEVIQRSINSLGDRVVRASDVLMSRGFLANIVVQATDPAIKPGQLYVAAYVLRGGLGAKIAIGQILGGYATTFQSLAWPGSPIIQATEGHGFFTSVDFASFPLGGPISVFVPTNARWALLSLAGRFVTGATVTNRLVSLNLAGPSGGGLSHPANVLQAASSAAIYNWGRGLVYNSQIGPLVAFWTIPLLQETTMQAGSFIATDTQNMQAGDQWFDVSLRIQEWLDP